MICWEEERLLCLDFLTPHSLIMSLSNMILFWGNFKWMWTKIFFSLNNKKLSRVFLRAFRWSVALQCFSSFFSVFGVARVVIINNMSLFFSISFIPCLLTRVESLIINRLFIVEQFSIVSSFLNQIERFFV